MMYADFYGVRSFIKWRMEMELPCAQYSQELRRQSVKFLKKVV